MANKPAAPAAPAKPAAPANAAPAAAAPAPKKARRLKISRAFVAPGGLELSVQAKGQENGSFECFTRYRERDAAGKATTSKRGANKTAANQADAQAYVDEAVKTALAKGWTERAKGAKSGGARKDAFDLASLPSPKK